jgi:simple sugar transport system permease protein
MLTTDGGSAPETGGGLTSPAQEAERRWADRLRPLAMTLGAAVAALVTGGLILWAARANPIVAYVDMIKGVIDSKISVALVLYDVVPLLTIGLGLALAFRARVWNIGAEGQFLMGALAGGAVGINFPVDVGPIIWPVTLLAGAAAGALWGWIVGMLRARWNVNEVITSLLLVYVASFFLAYAVRQPLRDPESFLPQSAALPRSARLAALPWIDVHFGIVIALLLVPVVAYLMYRTPFGFRTQMLGLNPEATRAAGGDPSGLIVKVMMLSGGLAGLAGIMQVMGSEIRLTNNLSPGFGFTAIIVALLGRMKPVGVALAAIFIAVLSVGGDALQRSQELPRAVVAVIQALFVIFLLIGERLGRRR